MKKISWVKCIVLAGLFFSGIAMTAIPPRSKYSFFLLFSAV